MAPLVAKRPGDPSFLLTGISSKRSWSTWYWDGKTGRGSEIGRKPFLGEIWKKLSE
jgi:hypothetical protein